MFFLKLFLNLIILFLILAVLPQSVDALSSGSAFESCASGGAYNDDGEHDSCSVSEGFLVSSCYKTGRGSNYPQCGAPILACNIPYSNSSTIVPYYYTCELRDTRLTLSTTGPIETSSHTAYTCRDDGQKCGECGNSCYKCSGGACTQDNSQTYSSSYHTSSCNNACVTPTTGTTACAQPTNPNPPSGCTGGLCCAVCGDGICDGYNGENASNCNSDCGSGGGGGGGGSNPCDGLAATGRGAGACCSSDSQCTDGLCCNSNGTCGTCGNIRSPGTAGCGFNCAGGGNSLCANFLHCVGTDESMNPPYPPKDTCWEPSRGLDDPCGGDHCSCGAGLFCGWTGSGARCVCATSCAPASSVACGTQARNCGADCGYTGTYCPTAGEVCISNRCLPQPNPPVHVCYPASGLPQDIDLCNNEAAISLAKTNISLKNAGPANACSTHTFRFWIFTNPDYITGPLPLPSGGNNPAEVVYDSGWMTSDLKNFNQVLSISAGLALGYDSILFDGTSYYWRAQAWSESCNLFSALSNAWMFKYTPVDPYLQTTQGDVHTNKEIDVSGGPPN